MGVGTLVGGCGKLVGRVGMFRTVKIGDLGVLIPACLKNERNHAHLFTLSYFCNFTKFS